MGHTSHKPKSEHGVTILEMLIVVAVIGILSAMAIPSLTGFLSASKEDALLSDKGSLQSAFDGYRSAKPDNLPIVIETGDTTTTSAASLSACLGTMAASLRTTSPKNNCFINLAELAAPGFLSSAASVESASSDNVVGGTGLYSWAVLANGEVAAFEKSTGARVTFVSDGPFVPMATPTEETGF